MKNDLDTTSKEEIKDVEDEQGLKIDFGNLNIGDFSLYYSYTNVNTDIQDTIIYYIYKTNFVRVSVTDKNDKSLNDAIRIAKLVKSRLD